MRKLGFLARNGMRLKIKVIFNSSGFTMIELLMVIVVIGVLGALAVPQFTDFRREANVAAAQQLEHTITTGILLQHKQSVLRCNNISNSYMPAESLEQNDITVGTGALCSVTQITSVADRKIFDGPTGAGSFPVNPVTGLNTIGVPAALSSGQSYASSGTCTASDEGTLYGWCYDQSTGSFFASNNPNPDREPAGGESSSGESSSAGSSAPSCDGGSSWDGYSCVCPDGESWVDSQCIMCVGSDTDYTWNDATLTCHVVYHYENCPDVIPEDSVADSTSGCSSHLTACGDTSGNNWDDCNGSYVGL